MSGGLGWFPSHDLRRAAYPMRGAPPARRPPRRLSRRFRYWYADAWWGDQGSTSQCVAYGSLHLLHAPPFTYPAPRPKLDPGWLYGEAQRVDPWEGEDYDGTSSDAAMAVLKREGAIASYWWAESFDEAIACVVERSPVCFGTSWRAGMDEPDEDGFIRATGGDRGGHLYLVDGANLDRRAPGATRPGVARIKNSWSRAWARAGHALIALEDLERLFDDWGEAVIVVERP